MHRTDGDTRYLVVTRRSVWVRDRAFCHILHVVTFCMLSHFDIFLMADRGVALRLRESSGFNGCVRARVPLLKLLSEFSISSPHPFTRCVAPTSFGRRTKATMAVQQTTVIDLDAEVGTEYRNEHMEVLAWSPRSS